MPTTVKKCPNLMIYWDRERKLMGLIDLRGLSDTQLLNLFVPLFYRVPRVNDQASMS